MDDDDDDDDEYSCHVPRVVAGPPAEGEVEFYLRLMPPCRKSRLMAWSRCSNYCQKHLSQMSPH